MEDSGFKKYLSLDDLFLCDEELAKKQFLNPNCKKSRLYLIIKGYMDIFYPDKNGRNHILTRIYSKDYQLGGVPKYLDRNSKLLNGFLMSLSKDAVLYEIKEDVISELFKKADFVEFIFSKHFKLSTSISLENYFRSVFSLEEFLAYILYYHSEDEKYEVDNYSSFSELLKCNRTNLYRQITSLEEIGVIKKEKKTIKILSMEKLKYIFQEKI